MLPLSVSRYMVAVSHDAGRDTDGKVTLRDGFAHSSNVYFAKAVYGLYKDDPVTYTDHLERARGNRSPGD